MLKGRRVIPAWLYPRENIPRGVLLSTVAHISAVVLGVATMPAIGALLPQSDETMEILIQAPIAVDEPPRPPAGSGPLAAPTELPRLESNEPDLAGDPVVGEGGGGLAMASPSRRSGDTPESASERGSAGTNLGPPPRRDDGVGPSRASQAATPGQDRVAAQASAATEGGTGPRRGESGSAATNQDAAPATPAVAAQTASTGNPDPSPASGPRVGLVYEPPSGTINRSDPRGMSPGEQGPSSIGEPAQRDSIATAAVAGEAAANVERMAGAIAALAETASRSAASRVAVTDVGASATRLALTGLEVAIRTVQAELETVRATTTEATTPGSGDALRAVEVTAALAGEVPRLTASSEGLASTLGQQAPPLRQAIAELQAIATAVTEQSERERAVLLSPSPAIAQVFFASREVDPRLPPLQEAEASPRRQEQLAAQVARFERAAAAGYAIGAYNLADALARGRGVAPDPVRATAIFRDLAQRGFAAAQLRLAEAQLSGAGIPADPAQAYATYDAAARRGNVAAERARDAMGEQISAETIQEAGKRVPSVAVVYEEQAAQRPKEDQDKLDAELRRALQNEDFKAADKLLLRGADPNRFDAIGRTAMIEAAWRGRARTISMLIERGADIDSADAEGRSALTWASINGFRDVAARLVAAKADLDLRDRAGMSPLMRASWNGHAAVAEVLVRGGADRELRDRQGRTALDHARAQNDTQIAGILSR